MVEELPEACQREKSLGHPHDFCVSPAGGVPQVVW